MKKLICILISISLIFALAGCRRTTDTVSSSEGIAAAPSSNTDTKIINLLYSYSDTFNPYTASTDANRNLTTLLYDPLVKTDNSFKTVYALASSAQTVEKVCTVKLRDAAFTDGSTVTADDVIYSYNLAKNCPFYTYNFYEVASVNASDSKTVVFNLSQYDEYFINLLTFPIVKSGSSGATDADGKEIPPIGCGRYYISKDGDSLILNTSYYGKKGSIETIKLINSPDADSTSHYVEVGATHVYYTDDDNIVRMSGKKTEVNLNRLIYIGINSSYGSLQSKEMRYAISSALDRSAICQTAYYNNAIAAKGFFNPYFEATGAVQTIESKPNSKITVENLSKIGYNNMNSNGYYANNSGNNPVFTLLVNSENSSRVIAANLIAQQCKAAGIQINVVECSYEQYVERLSTNNFQLYLGEIQILDNMDMAQLVIPGGSAAYGVGLESAQTQNSESLGDENSESYENAKPSEEQTKQSSCESIINSYRSGKCGISDVAGTLLTEMPQIPICYRNGVLFYDSAIVGGVSASRSDIYLSIENYEF